MSSSTPQRHIGQSRLERHLDRQRGTGARNLTTTFGFSLNLPPLVANNTINRGQPPAALSHISHTVQKECITRSISLQEPEVALHKRKHEEVVCGEDICGNSSKRRHTRKQDVSNKPLAALEPSAARAHTPPISKETKQKRKKLTKTIPVDTSSQTGLTEVSASLRDPRSGLLAVAAAAGHQKENAATGVVNTACDAQGLSRSLGDTSASKQKTRARHRRVAQSTVKTNSKRQKHKQDSWHEAESTEITRAPLAETESNISMNPSPKRDGNSANASTKRSVVRKPSQRDLDSLPPDPMATGKRSRTLRPKAAKVFSDPDCQIQGISEQPLLVLCQNDMVAEPGPAISSTCPKQRADLESTELNAKARSAFTTTSKSIQSQPLPRSNRTQYPRLDLSIKNKRDQDDDDVAWLFQNTDREPVKRVHKTRLMGTTLKKSATEKDMDLDDLLSNIASFVGAPAADRKRR